MAFKFSDFLVFHRRRLRMTPAEAARFLKVPTEHYGEWESGAETPVDLLEEAVRGRMKAAQAVGGEHMTKATPPPDEYFPAALDSELARLKKLGWRQAALSEVIGVTRGTMIRWAHQKIKEPNRATRVGVLEILRAIQTGPSAYAAPTEQPFTQKFASEIKRLKEQGWRQGRISDYLGVDANSVFLWKTGGSVPPAVATRQGILALLAAVKVEQ